MSTSTERRGGLGRGLGELFQRTETIQVAQRPEEVPGPASPSAVEPVPVPAGSYFAELAIETITPNPRQPRAVFDEEALSELVESIGEVGLLQPIVVRPVDDGRFELVMGERRWRAAGLAGQQTIPAIVRRTEDHDLLRDALLENLHRVQLNPLEEAAAYQQMLEDFGCTQDELSTRIKRSRPQISNTIRLLKLPASVQRRVAAGVLSAGHARALLGLADPAAQERLAQRIVAEGLSVRAVEEIVALGEADSEPIVRRRVQRSPSPGPASSHRCSPTTSRPGSGWTRADPRVGSPSSSPPPRTWSGSCWRCRSIDLGICRYSDMSVGREVVVMTCR